MIYDIQTPTWILHTSSLQVKNGLMLIFCLFHKTNRRGCFLSHFCAKEVLLWKETTGYHFTNGKKQVNLHRFIY